MLRGSPATLRFTNLDQDGAATAAAGAVTLGIVRGDGSQLVAPGASTTGSNPYEYILAASGTALLDQLTVTWSDAGNASTHQTIVDVAGGYYLTLAEMRGLPNLADDTKISDAKLLDARRWFEDRFERYTGKAFVPRYQRRTLDATGYREMTLPGGRIRAVRSLRIYTDPNNYIVLTSSELEALFLTAVGGRIESLRPLGFERAQMPLGFTQQSIVIEYEYGEDCAPSDVREAAELAIRDKAMTDFAGMRQYSIQTEQGVVRNALPGPGTPFGIPYVDDVANRYRDLVLA